MAKSYTKSKGRKSGGKGFLAIPHEVLEHENFRRLSPYAAKLLLDLGVQYRGNNNGDLAATWSMMQKRGWRSKATLQNAVKELESRGLILNARQGGKHKPSLYALTWNRIDECNGKLDIRPTSTAPGTWKKTIRQYSSPKLKCYGNNPPHDIAKLFRNKIKTPTPYLGHIDTPTVPIN